MTLHHLFGTWRSYKAFYCKGAMRKHSADSYVELSVNEDNLLTIKSFLLKPGSLVKQTNQWEIKESGKRKYLYIINRQAYEIITLDAGDLVLSDNVKGETIFFSPLKEWHGRINPAKNIEDNAINIWSKSLIELLAEKQMQ